MRNGLVLVGMAFAVTLAIAVANRLSEQALAVAVGALCGMAASLPVSLAFVIATRRNWGRPETVIESSAPRVEPEPSRFPQLSPRDALWRQTQSQPQQPIIVIAPPQPNQAAYAYGNGPLYLPPQPDDGRSGREFKIIGDE